MVTTAGVRLEETPQWQVGDWAERTVEQWAHRQGFATLKLSGLGRHNRAVLPDGSRLAMPDFGLMGTRGLEAVEVKYKEAPALYQKAREFRHGVDLPVWRAYLHIQKEFGVPVMVWIVEWRPGTNAAPRPVLLRAMVDMLAPHVQEMPVATRQAPRGMAYWNRALMDLSALPESVGAPPLHLPRLEHPWERTSRGGHAPQAGDGVSERHAESRQLGLFE
jgi:hypothetical protein